ncbi:hypothetical protein Ndes2526B_g07064 [Nannochloris sp. 'desiccata']
MDSENQGNNLSKTAMCSKGPGGLPVAPTAGLHGGHQSNSQGNQQAPLEHNNSYVRPPLLRLRSLPTSVASSREGSPRSAISEAPSMATAAMANLAQYRAGARTFKADPSQRSGFKTGDVIALRIKGAFLAAIPISHKSSEPDSILYILAPSDIADPSAAETHFEVIKQGQWVGFRSAVASDRLLQARRRGAHRLAFFSPNLGTWEQWEIPEASSLESLPWNSASVTLRNRRLPTCELRVEFVRVGTCTMMPHAAITPRSLPAATTSTAVAIEDESLGENPNIRRMSGLLVNEWLAFVEREKKLRNVLEARMEQAVEDATGLREWAASQVEGVRKDVEEEVELLLAALSRKSAALEDVQSRLETRVRWGVALLEAKKAAVLGRRVLQAWRAVTARSKYCNNVATKLQERAAIRTTADIMTAWSDHCLEQRLRRQRLRAAVRRMAFLKMHNVILVWRAIVDERTAEDAAESNALAAVQAHLREWQLRRLMGGWRERSRRAISATRLLQGMATRCDLRAVEVAFSTMKDRVCQQKAALACFEVRAAANRRRASLETAFDSWRVAVDDTFGGQLQLVHAQRVISRRRGVRALQAWRGNVAQSKAEALRWRQVEIYERKRTLARALVLWREFTFERRDNRDVFIRFIHARAERRMLMALNFWRCYSAWKTHAALAVHHMVQRRAGRTVLSALSIWREDTAHAKVQRHRVATCHRKQRAEMLRKVVLALREHAAESIEEREMEKRAVGWHAGRLQARGLWAFVEAVNRRTEFITALSSVAAAVDKRELKSAWELWQQAAGQEKANQVAVYRFQHRRQWFEIKAAFGAWKESRQQAQWETTSLSRATVKLETSRLRWVLSVWRTVVAGDAQERQLVAFGQRRLAKLRLGNSFSALRTHAEWSLAVQDAVSDAAALKEKHTLCNCLNAWAAHAAVRAEQRTGVRHLVDRQATYLQVTVLSAWREHTQIETYHKEQYERGVNRLARLRLASCLAAWRQAADDGYGERIRLGNVGLTLAIRHHERLMKFLFTAWRGRTSEVTASLTAVDARHAASAAAVLRCAFSSWKNHADRMGTRREHVVDSMVERRAEKTQALLFTAWKYQSQLSARNAIVVLHRVERAATRACRFAFDAWRSAARERRQRRTAIVRFMQRSNKAMLGASFAAWRGVAEEKAAATEELRRCLLRKRIAFRQFKQWYWDSFDEDLQATLRAMFDFEADAEETAAALAALEEQHGGADGSADFAAELAFAAAGVSSSSAPRRGPSPVKSLLSSPIRRELEARRAYRSREEEEESEDFGAGNSVFSFASTSNLSAKIRAALADADLSPAPPVAPVPDASERTGSAVVAPLMDWFGVGNDSNGSVIPSAPPLSPVMETAESLLGSPSPYGTTRDPMSGAVAAVLDDDPKQLNFEEEENLKEIESEENNKEDEYFPSPVDSGFVSSQASTVATTATKSTVTPSMPVADLISNFVTPGSALPTLASGKAAGMMTGGGSRAATAPPPGTVYRTPLGEASVQPAWHTPFSALPLSNTGAASRTATGSSSESISYKFGAFPAGRSDLASTPRLVDNPLAVLSPRRDNMDKEN